MYDIRIVFSLCFLFASAILNGLTTIYIIRQNTGFSTKQNLYPLSLVLFFHSLYAFVAILVWSNWKFVDAGAPFATLYGPLLWHLTLMSKNKNHNIQRIKWHFIPFFIFTIGYIYSLTHPENTNFIKQFTRYLYLIAEIQFVFYLFYSIITMRRIKSTNEKAFKTRITFFNYLYLLSAIVVFLFLTTTIDHLFFPEVHSQKEVWSYSIHLLVLGISILFHLVVVKQWHFVGFRNALEPIENLNRGHQEKYQSTINKRPHLVIVANKIQDVSDDVFKDPNLNLQQFAEVIDEPANLITQTFSIELDTNFNQYINKKRLEFASHLLLSEENSELSIADIAFESGFNSEASFYRAFRSNFNTTPRKFQKEHQTTN
ncbi:MAG TPA: helix-turn-helix domain-containing protein [Aequorivita sp.]|nr:helix-turn-helix domain-containing protein [Aequorivita sp.]